MKRILTIMGTRPEAVKLAPVILEMRKCPGQFENLVCVTAQHRQMLDQVLAWFRIEPRYDLDLMQPDQGLGEFAGRALLALDDLFQEVRPDAVIVQGDTTTVMTAALSAFYRRIPVAHVEAGLRTDNRYDPFPEELNRRLTGALATLHFAPTVRAADALRTERVPEESIFITGNTVVDALLMTVKRRVRRQFDLGRRARRLLLVTAHRRESFGAPLESICRALRNLAERNDDIEIIYPVHHNPNVRQTVARILAERPRIRLLDPMRYEQFIHVMAKAHLIMTDSGGVQEEAAVLGKPVLVLRNTTERPEVIEAGTGRLVGTDGERIVAEAERLLHNDEAYRAMARAVSEFGDGHAAERIKDILLAKL